MVKKRQGAEPERRNDDLGEDEVASGYWRCQEVFCRALGVLAAENVGHDDGRHDEAAYPAHLHGKRYESSPIDSLSPEGEFRLLAEQSQLFCHAGVFHHPHEKTGHGHHEAVNGEGNPGHLAPSQLQNFRRKNLTEAHGPIVHHRSPPVTRMKCRSRFSSTGTRR